MESEPDQYAHSSQSRADVFVPDWKDSLATGVPILATGKWIDPDSVSKPRVTLAGKPEITPVPSPHYVHPAGHPTVVQVPKDLPSFTPGKNGVPFPKVVKAGRKTSATGQPRPMPALAAEIKKSSIADFQHINVPQGMSNNIIWSVIEDKKGQYWVGTEQGLNLLIPKSVSAPGSSSSGDFQIISFGREDGIKFIGLGNGFLDRKNRIWWGTMMLDLNQFRLPEKAPQIQLDHIELKQKFVDFRRLFDTAYLHSLSLGENLPHTFDSIALFHNYPLNLKLPKTHSS